MDLSKAQKTKISKLGKQELQEELSGEGRSRFGQDSRWYIQKRLDGLLEEEDRAEKVQHQALLEKEISTAERALAASLQAGESCVRANSLSEEANSMSRGADLKSRIAVSISLVALVLAAVALLVR
jgi:hypothetical protein|tara:strand:+ start:5190 stop:5567 length:378 start_codon:yes stop_codon:yes gene_type:complete